MKIKLSGNLFVNFTTLHISNIGKHVKNKPVNKNADKTTKREIKFSRFSFIYIKKENDDLLRTTC